VLPVAPALLTLATEVLEPEAAAILNEETNANSDLDVALKNAIARAPSPNAVKFLTALETVGLRFAHALVSRVLPVPATPPGQ